MQTHLGRLHALAFALWLAGGSLATAAIPHADEFVRVSPRDPRYLELTDGSPYIPVGLNMIAPNTRPEEGLQRMEEWLQKLSSQGGNYARIWLSSPFWDVEHEKSGVYDAAKAQRIDALLALARKYGIRVKLTLEHFRTLDGEPRQKWAHKPLHHVSQGGTATNIVDYFGGAASRERFKQKLDWFAHRYGNNPSIFGWELWNEINAVQGGDYMSWTPLMLEELHRRFPMNMAMQSLGSYDHEQRRSLYCRHSLLPGNSIAQVHRYLDLGADWEVCHGPMDILAAEAIRELNRCQPGKPIILAESGAVEPNHAGPFKLYEKDQAGMLLHDVLFAPFFAGAAGAGQIWHWDQYVAKNNLWHHFGYFAEVIKGVDPVAEQFQPVYSANARLRIYVLKGRQTCLIWCRDAENNWRTELEQGIAPATVIGMKIHLERELQGFKTAKARTFNPWKGGWTPTETDRGSINLPAFSRSVVIKLEGRRE